MRKSFVQTALALIVTTAALVVPPAFAQDLNPVRSGWIQDNGTSASFGLPTNQNYLTGFNNPNGAEFRSFFVFDLTGVTGTITSATLLLYNPVAPPDSGNGFSSPDPSETYQLTSTSSTPADLQGTYGSGNATGQAVYASLGTGTIYSTVVATAADNGTTFALPFSAAGLADLNAGEGGLVGFGGRVTTIVGTNSQQVFAFTDPTGGNDLNNTPPVILRLTVAGGAAAPEPGTLILLGLGLAAVGGCARRTRRA